MAPRKTTFIKPAAAAFSGKRFLSEQEVEAIYGFCAKTLRNWRVLGRGPVYRKFGKSVMYQVTPLEAWIEAQPCGGDGVSASSMRKRQK